MTDIEQEYRRLIQALTPAQRMERAAAMWAWSQQMLARKLRAELGPISDERLKWEIALHRYGNSEQLGPLIRERLADVRD